METGEIITKLTTVFQKSFADPTLSLSPSTTANDIKGWDSLMHINLIVAVEKEFGVRFTSREITGLNNVGDLITLISRKGVKP